MTAESYYVERIRSQFPALHEGAAFFDGPGGTQTPGAVARRSRAGASPPPLSNRGRRHPPSAAPTSGRGRAGGDR